MNSPPPIWGASWIKAFVRGMVWAYTFNHEESVRCFEEVLSLYPDLVSAVGHRVCGGPEVQRGLGRIRPGRAWSVAGRARTELQLATSRPHTPASVCDDSGKFNRSVETVASARRTVSTTSES